MAAVVIKVMVRVLKPTEKVRRSTSTCSVEEEALEDHKVINLREEKKR